MAGLGLAFGEEVETLWSILSQAAPSLKYFSMPNWRLLYYVAVDHVCAVRATTLPDLLDRRHGRAVSLQKRTTTQLSKLAGEIEADSFMPTIICGLRNNTLQGLHCRFQSVFDACMSYLSDEADSKDVPDTVSQREKVRNKYVELLSRYYAAVKGVGDENVTQLDEKLREYVHFPYTCTLSFSSLPLSLSL